MYTAAAAAEAGEAVVPVAVLLAGEVFATAETREAVAEAASDGGGGAPAARPGRAVSIFALTFDDRRGGDPARLLQSVR